MLLTHQIRYMPPSQRRVIEPGTVVIPVQVDSAELFVLEFFAVVEVLVCTERSF